jgi:16S rRNA A1518/A1519 N6-dimethyltransferase RsmA/KsgA/DIM1 with predicted DNA glycosylase/AP lyase activity
VLHETVGPLGVRVVQGDALRIDFTALLTREVISPGPGSPVVATKGEHRAAHHLLAGHGDLRDAGSPSTPGSCEVGVGHLGGQQITPAGPELAGPDLAGRELESPARVSKHCSPTWVLVANLPYNVATPLLLRLLEEVGEIGRMLVMVQREAGERLVALPSTPAYGGVSVRVAYFATARLLGSVPATVFLPRPSVESVLVELERRESPPVDPLVASYAEIADFVRAGFAGRRKMLRRSLGGLVAPEVFAEAGVSGERRAEDLDIAAWGMLVQCHRRHMSEPRPS